MKWTIIKPLLTINEFYVDHPIEPERIPKAHLAATGHPGHHGTTVHFPAFFPTVFSAKIMSLSITG